MKQKIIVTNFKTYAEASGARAKELFAQHAEVAGGAAVAPAGVQFFCAVQALDLAELAAVERPDNLMLAAQHLDPVGYGSFTGKIVPERLVDLDVKAVIINHSENRLERFNLAKTIEAAKKAGLITFVCCETALEGRSFLEFEPDYLCLEPPELIGGDISVSKAEADLIEQTVQAVGPGADLLVGAGVKDADDVRIAQELGAHGVLVASGVCKADDPKAALQDLVSGFKM